MSIGQNYTWTVNGQTFVPGGPFPVAYTGQPVTITVTICNTNPVPWYIYFNYICMPSPTFVTSPAPTATPPLTYSTSLAACPGGTGFFSPPSGFQLGTAGTASACTTFTINAVAGAAGMGLLNFHYFASENSTLPISGNGTGGQVQFYIHDCATAVNPVPNQTLCAGNLTNLIQFSGSLPGSTYSWTNTNTTIGLAASGVGDISPFSVTNTTGTNQVSTITVTPYLNGCAGTATSFTITVKPNPNVNTVLNQSVCAGSIVSIPFSGTVASTTFAWTNTNTAIGLGASGNGNITSFVTTNTGTSPITGTITVTPNPLNGCTGTAKTFTITVKPIPTVNAVPNQDYCAGTSNAISFIGSITGTSYQWTNSLSAIGLGIGGFGNIPSFTAQNTGTNLLTANLAVSPSLSGCTGVTQSFTISVRPTPTASINGTTPVCQNDPNPPFTFTNPMAAPIIVTYTINNGANQSMNIAANASTTLNAPTAVAGLFVYNIVNVAYQSAPNCINSTAIPPVTLTVLPTQAVNIVKKVLNGPIFTAGNTLQFEITVANLSNTTQTGLSITDVLPPPIYAGNYTFVSTTVLPSGVAPTINLVNSTLTSTTFSLVAGAVFTFRYNVWVPEIRCSEVVQNCVTLSGNSGVCLPTAPACVSFNLLDPPSASPTAPQTFFYPGPINSIGAILAANPSAFTVVPGSTPIPIIIGGVLVIDKLQVTMDGCNITLSPGAEILVKANNSLIINNSSLHGCSKMWKGITLETGTIATGPTTAVNLGYTSIQDAEIAIRMNDKCKADVSNSYITNCYTGIYAPFTADYIKLYKTSFDGLGIASFLPSFLGQNLIPQGRGWAGLDLRNTPTVTYSLGTGTNPRNWFGDLHYGIRYENSTGSVDNCSFENIQYNSGYGGTGGGAAIFAIAPNTSAKRLKVSGNPFSSCFHGIYSVGLGVVLHHNDMTNMGNTSGPLTNSYAIKVQDAGGFNDSIYWNTIVSKTNGIHCEYIPQPLGYRTRVYNNMVTIDAPSGIAGGNGITVLHTGPFNPYRARVYDNIITIKNGFAGIAVANAKGVRINHNTVMLRHTTTSFPFTSMNGRKGIYLTNCETDTVSCNYVNTGPYNTGASLIYNSQYHEAIGIAMCKDIQLLGNQTHNTYHGLAFNGTGNTAMNLIQNEVKEHHYGWRLTAFSPMQGSTTVDNGNKWTGTYTTSGAGGKAVYSSLGFLTAAYSTQTPALGLLTPTTIVKPILALGYSLLSWNCTSPMLLPPSSGSDWYNQYARQIVGDSIPFSEYEAENRWVLKEELYRQMQADSSLYWGDTLLTYFRDTTANNDIGTIATIEELATAEYPSTLQAAINDLHTQIDNMQGLIDANVALLDTMENDTLLSILLQQITNQKVQLDLLNATFSELMGQVEEIDSLRVMQILYHNQGLEAEVAYSYNTRLINQIYYPYFQRERIVLDSVQLSTLWAIAGQCPSAGGPAVYQARAMLIVLGYNPDFADYDLCAIAQSPWRTMHNHSAIDEFVVYPNPTTGELYITHNPDFVGQSWKLYNTMGQCLKAGVFTEKETEKIDLSGYISGMYLLQTSNNVTKIILQ